MSRRTFFRTISTAALVGLATACAPYRRRDDGLHALALEALADASVYPGIADLRRGHAELLERENNRRCGVRPTGTSPEACSFRTITDAELETARGGVPRSEHDALERAATSLALAVEKKTVGSESWLVVSTIFSDIIQRLNADDPLAVRDRLEKVRTVRIRHGERPAFLNLATVEEAAIYSLGTAGAFAAGSTAQAYAAFRQEHSRALSDIHHIAEESSISLPVAASSYTFDPAEQVEDDSSAAALISTTEKASHAAWQRLIASTSNPDCGQWAMEQLAAASLRISKLVVLGVH